MASRSRVTIRWVLGAKAVGDSHTRRDGIPSRAHNDCSEVDAPYDLDQLHAAGVDLSSPAFIKLVDAKLAELRAAPLAPPTRPRPGRGYLPALAGF